MESTLVRPVKKGTKIVVEPGETFEAIGSQADVLLKRGRFELESGSTKFKDKSEKTSPAKTGESSKAETNKERKAREAQEVKDVKTFNTFKEMVDSRTPEQFEKLVANLDAAIDTLPEVYQEEARTYVTSKMEGTTEDGENGTDTDVGDEETNEDEEDTEDEEAAA